MQHIFCRNMNISLSNSRIGIPSCQTPEIWTSICPTLEIWTLICQTPGTGLRVGFFLHSNQKKNKIDKKRQVTNMNIIFSKSRKMNISLSNINVKGYLALFVSLYNLAVRRNPKSLISSRQYQRTKMMKHPKKCSKHGFSWWRQFGQYSGRSYWKGLRPATNACGW